MAQQPGRGAPWRPGPEHQEFVDRYQQDPGSIPPPEAYERYQQVAPQLSAQDYQEAARQAFARMTPEERRQMVREMSQQAQTQGYPPPFPDVNQNGIDDRVEDPRYLAQATAQYQQQQPDLLRQLFGSGAGAAGGAGMLGNPWAKGALGGIAAFGLARMLGGGGHGGGLFGGGGHHGGGLFGGGGGHGGGHHGDDDD